MSRVDVIEEAKRYLETVPNVKWAFEKSAIEVEPPDPSGYRMALDEDEEEAVLWCHHWHQHFDNAEDCLRLFKNLIERRSRVIAVTRGSNECSWTLEVFEDGAWASMGMTGLIFVAFWKRKGEIFYENAPRV